MEYHHFDQAVMILNSEGNNIFASLSHDQYRQIITLIRMAILSTDLAIYFKKRDTFRNLVNEIGSDHHQWVADESRKELLSGMLMTACDLGAITKPWNVQYKVAHLVASEFFEQGDIEREKLNEEPIDDCTAIANLKELIEKSDTEIARGIVDISSKYDSIPRCLKQLQDRKCNPSQAEQLIDGISDDFNANVRTKLGHVLQKNTGFKTLVERDFEGYSLEEQLLLSRSPVTSSDVERLFSEYKAFMRSNRTSMTK